MLTGYLCLVNALISSSECEAHLAIRTEGSTTAATTHHWFVRIYYAQWITQLFSAPWTDWTIVVNLAIAIVISLGTLYQALTATAKCFGWAMLTGCTEAFWTNYRWVPACFKTFTFRAVITRSAWFTIACTSKFSYGLIANTCVRTNITGAYVAGSLIAC